MRTTTGRPLDREDITGFSWDNALLAPKESNCTGDIVNAATDQSLLERSTFEQSANSKPAKTRGKCGLLVSVRSAEEARTALQFPIEWIDVKEPDRGALGQPDIEVALEIQELIRGFKGVPPHFSIAMGEWANTRISDLIPYTRSFSSSAYFKLAFGQVGSNINLDALRSLKDSLGPHRLILVHYADWASCNSPSWEHTLAAASQLDTSVILIDTGIKNGKGLLDHYELTELSVMIRAGAQAGVAVTLAGALTLPDLRLLQTIGAAQLGVRSAVCCDANRRLGVCPIALKKAVDAMSWDLGEAKRGESIELESSREGMATTQRIENSCRPGAIEKSYKE